MLGSLESFDSSPSLDIGTGVITLPTTGSYTVRVRIIDESFGSDIPTGYRFQLRLEP